MHLTLRVTDTEGAKDNATLGEWGGGLEHEEPCTHTKGW
jgi:hypothetical protein